MGRELLISALLSDRIFTQCSGPADSSARLYIQACTDCLGSSIHKIDINLVHVHIISFGRVFLYNFLNYCL